MLRVNSTAPCPVCKKPDWCLVSQDGKRAICTRTPSGRYIERCRGWLHRTNGPAAVSTVSFAHKLPPAVVEAVHQAAVREIADDDVDWLSNDLGVSGKSLRQLGVGWHTESEAYSFPMWTGSGEIIGLRLRQPEGRKFALTGSRAGLFIPTGMRDPLGTLFVVEGESDCAALLTYGIDAVGRPSCRGCEHRLQELIRRLSPERVVLVADADQPGIAGAKWAATAIRHCVSSVEVIYPEGYKDVREMLQARIPLDHLEECFTRV